MLIKPQTREFVDREQALNSFSRMLEENAVRALVFQAPDGMGKSFLLRELRLYCESSSIQVLLMETDGSVVPDHWRILGRLVEQWGDALPRTGAVLNEIQSLTGPLERLPGGGIMITGGIVNVTGNLVGGTQLVYAGDAHEREYHGWSYRVDSAFFADLTQLCRTLKQATSEETSTGNPSLRGLMLLFDNVDRATQETCDWLTVLLRRIWEGNFPGLCVAMTGEGLPASLAGAAADCLDHVTLEAFRQEDVNEYLSRVGLPSEMAAHAFLFSGGKPGVLNTIARTALTSLRRAAP